MAAVQGPHEQHEQQRSGLVFGTSPVPLSAWFRGYPQFVQANVRIVVSNKPLRLLSIDCQFPISFDAEKHV